MNKGTQTRKPRARRSTAALALVLLTLILTACGASLSAVKLVVIDKTGSARGSEALCRKDAVAWVRGLYGGVRGQRGEIRADIFDSDNAGAPAFPKRVNFVIDPRDGSSARRVENAINGKLDKLDSELQGLLASRPAGGPTDLMAMFAGVGEAAHAQHADTVFVCSDGIDNRLQRDPTPRHAAKIVAGLDRGSLPNLNGIKVVFDTSSVQGRSHLDAVTLAAIYRFVADLVRRSGGTLISYGYGAGTG